MKLVIEVAAVRLLRRQRIDVAARVHPARQPAQNLASRRSTQLDQLVAGPGLLAPPLELVDRDRTEVCFGTRRAARLLPCPDVVPAAARFLAVLRVGDG